VFYIKKKGEKVSSKSGKIYELFVARDVDSFNAEVSLIKRDPKTAKVIESESIRGIAARTGQPKFYAKGYDYLRAKGGCPEGNLYLWINPKYIQQNGDLVAEGREIGQFYPISSSEFNHREIRNPEDPSQVRWDIGLHPDNAFRGSAGCVVIVRQSDFKAVDAWLDAAFKDGVEKVPFTVFRKQLS
jgi:hypothetical protein